MNRFIPSEYLEHVDELAVGIEPRDFARGGRVAHPLCLVAEKQLRGLPAPRVQRHSTSRHVLLYVVDRVPGPIDVRILEACEALPPGRFPGRFVPRRLRIPTVAEAPSGPAANRVRRPVLFPGAAYGVPSLATGVRGRITRGGSPLRWVRVTAELTTGLIVGRACGDHAGEFLLLLDSTAMRPSGTLLDPVPIRLQIFGPMASLPSPTDASDDLWDLPLEVLPAPGAPDGVSEGTTLPGNYVGLVGLAIDIPLRTLHRETVNLT